MKKIVLLSAICFITLFTNSCVKYVPTFTSVPTVNNEIPNNVQLFFKGEELPEKYEKIGLVEVSALQKRRENDEMIINHLKYEAYLKGANAIIFVEGNYEIRQRRNILMNLYGTKVYKGIAVKIESDSINTTENSKNSPFLQKIEDQKKQKEKQKQHLKTAGILTGIVGFITLIVIAMSNN